MAGSAKFSDLPACNMQRRSILREIPWFAMLWLCWLSLSLAFSIWKGAKLGGGLSAGQVHARVLWACLHVYIARHGDLLQP
jgi:hypothetical protein